MSTVISEIKSDCVIQANGSRWVEVECEIEEAIEKVAHIPEKTAREIAVLMWTYAGLDAMAHAATIRTNH